MIRALLHFAGAAAVFSLFWTMVGLVTIDEPTTAPVVEQVIPNFPPAFDRTVPATDFEWDPTLFIGFDEPSLRQAASLDRWRRTYRFVWYRRDPGPVVLRLERDRTGGGVLFVKTGTATDETGRSRVLRSYTVRLDASQIQSVLRALDERRYWDERNPQTYLPCFSDVWAMEGVDTGRYGIEATATPGDGHLRHAALLLLLYSGLRIDDAV